MEAEKNKARYIDEDKLVAELDKLVAEYLKDNSIQCSLAAGVTADIRDTVLKEIPTADVAPVKHGEWVKSKKCEHKPYRIKNPDKWFTYKCSECYYENGRSKKANYCPNCGAKMDGGKNV